MPVQIVEKPGEGLSHVYDVTVPAQDLLDRLETRLAEVRPQVNLKGFRPGKVPAAHVKRMYGKALMGEIVELTLNESQQQALTESKLRPAANPDVKVQSDLNKVLAGEADLAFEMAVEVMPDFDPVDPAELELRRPVYAPSDEDIQATLTQLVESNRTYQSEDGAEAAEGDMVVSDFVGRIDGEAFEGGTVEGSEVVIGSGRFIPGFEDQLKGAKAGEARTVELSFPQDYAAERLAGRAAVFEVSVKEVRRPQDSAVDDAFAQRLGMESLESLEETIRNQLSQEYQAASRYKAKRALLDVLDERHDFPLPTRMVDGEFAAIWKQVEAERASGELSEEDKGKSEEQLSSEYRKIAARRVRLGLVLAEIGQRHNVVVTEQEMAVALAQEARGYPGQERQIYEFFRNNPQAAAQLRAPIYEEKVVDLILDRANVENLPVSKEELFKDDELPEGYADT